MTKLNLLIEKILKLNLLVDKMTKLNLLVEKITKPKQLCVGGIMLKSNLRLRYISQCKCECFSIFLLHLNSVRHYK